MSPIALRRYPEVFSAAHAEESSAVTMRLQDKPHAFASTGGWLRAQRCDLELRDCDLALAAIEWRVWGVRLR